MYISDYALIIILITVVLRLVLSPVDITQRVNSAKMQLINPEIQSLQKRYANNPQQVQLKLRELYKKYNVKPMAGCLPMILQLVLNHRRIFFSSFVSPLLCLSVFRGYQE